MGVLYKNIETEEILTVDEVRAAYCRLVMEVQGIYSSMTFDEYLNEATSKNGSLRAIRERYLVIGHSCEYRGELVCKRFDTAADAYGFVNERLNGKDAHVTISFDVVNYTTEDNYDTYEIHKLGNEPFVLISWNDSGAETEFVVVSFDVEDDAYRAVIEDMHSLIATGDEDETAVWFANGEAEIDYGEVFYRWRIISNK